MYESKNEPLLHPRRFANRVLVHVLYAVGIIGVTVLIGALGHRWFGGHTWHNAWVNAAFVVGGLGTYHVPDSTLGKLFFASYGFVVGLIVMATLGVVLAPVVHRIMHKFHLDDDGDGGSADAGTDARASAGADNGVRAGDGAPVSAAGGGTTADNGAAGPAR